MIFAPPREWVALAFDCDGKIGNRAVNFGTFEMAARLVQAEADHHATGFDLGGALIVDPRLSPAELKDILFSALSLRLPEAFRKYFPDQFAPDWLGNNITKL